MKKIRFIDYKYPKQNCHMMTMPHIKNPKPVDKDYKFINKNIVYRFLCACLRVVAWIVLPIWVFFGWTPRILGKKHLRAQKNSGAIIVANHAHMMDVPLICACATRLRKIRFVILKENISIPVAGTIITALGGIPLAQNYGGMKEFNKAIDHLLHKKKWVLMYPETALWPYFTGLRAFKGGAFMFAAKNNVKIIPMALTFTINKKGAKKRMFLHILPAISPDGLTQQQLLDKSRHCILSKMNEFYSNPKYNKSGKQINVDHATQQDFGKDMGKESPEINPESLEINPESLEIN